MAETQTQAGGVGGQPAPQGGAAPIAPAPQSGGQPNAGAAQSGAQSGGGQQAGQAAQPVQKQSWTDDPEYQKQQSARDRREAAARAEALAERQRAQVLEQQLQQLQLANADPEERARITEQQLTAVRDQQKQATEQQRILLEAAAMVQEAGYKPEDFVNDFTDLSDRGLVGLATAIARRAKADAVAARKDAELAHERGKQAALAEAGVTKTSNEAGPAVGKADDIRRQMAALKGTGRVSEYLELRRQLSEAEAG